jgi:hypothetical protein
MDKDSRRKAGIPGINTLGLSTFNRRLYRRKGWNSGLKLPE